MGRLFWKDTVSLLLITFGVLRQRTLTDTGFTYICCHCRWWKRISALICLPTLDYLELLPLSAHGMIIEPEFIGTTRVSSLFLVIWRNYSAAYQHLCFPFNSKKRYPNRTSLCAQLQRFHQCQAFKGRFLTFCVVCGMLALEVRLFPVLCCIDVNEYIRQASHTQDCVNVKAWINQCKYRATYIQFSSEKSSHVWRAATSESYMCLWVPKFVQKSFVVFFCCKQGWSMWLVDFTVG